MTCDDLNCIQKNMYNDLIIEFNQHYIESKGERLGQAFFNYYYGKIFHGSYPELFYCTDNKKSIEMISICLVDYVFNI